VRGLTRRVRPRRRPGRGRGVWIPGGRRSLHTERESVGMAIGLLQRWRIRRTLKAWARGELEFAGALGWRSELQR